MADSPSKPYLGGFRNPATATLYHHANSQTPAPQVEGEVAPPLPHTTRQTQTTATHTANHGIQAHISTAIQTPTYSRGIFLSAERDKTLFVSRGRYVTGDEVVACRLQKCIALQCWWRQRLARRQLSARVARRLADADTAAAVLTAHHHRVAADAAEAQRRRLAPRTPSDFSVLFDELEQWRVHETARVRVECPNEGAERTARLAAVLTKEVAVIHHIGRLRNVARAAAARQAVEDTLVAGAAPRRWRLSSGDTAVVTPPGAGRADALRALLASLEATAVEPPLLPRVTSPTPGDRPSEAYASQAAAMNGHSTGSEAGLAGGASTTRLAALQALARWVREGRTEEAATPASTTTKRGSGGGEGHGLRLHDDLLELVAREQSALQRGRPASSLRGLQTRIQTLVLAAVAGGR